MPIQSSDAIVVSDQGDIYSMPAAAFLDNGRLLFAWEQDNVIWGAVHGGALGMPFQIGSAPGVGGNSVVLTALSGDNFAAAWRDIGPGQELRARVMNINGAGGSEFSVDEEADFTPTELSITTLDNGGFAIAWADYANAGGTNYYGGKYRLYSADGTAAGQSWFFNRDAVSEDRHPSIVDGGGNSLVIAWDDGPVRLGRVVGGIGPVAWQTDVSLSGVYATRPDVVALSNGNILVVWEGQVGAEFVVKTRMFNADGSPRGDETIIVNGSKPELAELGDGRFVIGWQSGALIYTQLYNADGSLAGGAVATTADNILSSFDNWRLTGSESGKFAISWLQSPEVRLEPYLVVARSFNANIFSGTAAGDRWTGSNVFADSMDGAAGNDVLSGGGGNDRLLGGLGNDVLSGGAGVDILNGGLGGDRMMGGLGNDTYVVDSLGDIVTEVGGSGIDAIQSSVSINLARMGGAIERVTLIGAAPINSTGNAFANVMIGNAAANVLSGGGAADTLIGGVGNDRLEGGVGQDRLTGGLGRDVFVFADRPGVATFDIITDFSVVDDRIWLDNAVMPALGRVDRSLDAQYYHESVTGRAHDANDRIIYELDTGRLFYDPDGTGRQAQVLLAIVANRANLDATDFAVV